MGRKAQSFKEDLVAGSVCGITTVMISHPIETLLIQRKINSPEVYQNMFHSLRLIYKRQGLIDGFYRGNMSLPLISPAFITATQFFLYGQLKREFVKKENEIKEYLFCGAFTGLILSLIETPMGLILGQIHGNLNRRHTHVFDFHLKDCCKYIYENNGGFKGFYKGLSATIISSMTTSMFYFGGYEYMKKHLYEKHFEFLSLRKNQSYLRKDILLSGAIGGLFAWSICYPLDLIRLEIQSDDLRPGKKKYSSYFDCIKQIYQENNSIKSFYKGCFPGILKAIPINAACFLAYEEVYRLFS